MRKLALALLAALPIMAQASTVKIDDWYYSSRIDPITDEDSSMALTQDGKGGAIGIHCNNGEPMVVPGSGKYLGSNQELPVTWRVDDNQPVTKSLPVIDSFVVMPNSVMKDMVTGQKIVIRFTDYRQQQYTHTFSLRGYYDATGLLSCVD